MSEDTAPVILEDDGGWAEALAAPKLAKTNEEQLKRIRELERELTKSQTGMYPATIETKAQAILSIVDHKLNKGTGSMEEDELTALKLLELRAQEEAKRIHKTESIAADLSLLEGEALDLDQALHMNFEPPLWRIHGLCRVGHITTVAGAAKSGKTSLLVNRVKSFVDGNRLFGEFKVENGLTEGYNVGVWNYELTPGTMVDWFRNAGIINRHRVKLLNARGAGLFIQNDIVLEKAIAWCNDNKIEILEVDPLQAAFTGSINSDEDAASYIHALERIQKESCVKDIFLTTHMGHGAKNNPDMERSIGSARWEGFADNMWLYKRPDDLGLLRIDKGRDVYMEEFAVRMDPDTKILSYQPKPKVIDENWNAMIRELSDGEFHLKKEVTESRGESAGFKTAINKHITDFMGFGIIEEVSWKREDDAKFGEFSPDGTKGQAAKFIRMNDTGLRLLKEQHSEATPLTRDEWEALLQF